MASRPHIHPLSLRAIRIAGLEAKGNHMDHRQEGRLLRQPNAPIVPILGATLHMQNGWVIMRRQHPQSFSTERSDQDTWVDGFQTGDGMSCGVKFKST